ncbi:MAG TPA: hypothetical protein VIT68_01925, partial [Candidatus Gracilibacteria bacterium]
MLLHSGSGDDWSLQQNDGVGTGGEFGIYQLTAPRFKIFGDGRVGAVQYCNIAGGECFTAASIAALGGGSFGGDLGGVELTDSADDIVGIGDGINDTVLLNPGSSAEINATGDLDMTDNDVRRVNSVRFNDDGGDTNIWVVGEDGFDNFVISLEGAGGDDELLIGADGNADFKGTLSAASYCLPDGTGCKTVTELLDNTDSQDLTLSGNTLSLTGDGTSVDLSGFATSIDGLSDAVAHTVSQNIFLGNGAGGTFPLLSVYNSGVGINTLNKISTGDANTGFGSEALLNTSTGDYNTGIGWRALRANTSSGYNTAVGSESLNFNTGQHNTAEGYRSLYWNTSGGFNTGVGTIALSDNTIGSYNTGVGNRSLLRNDEGSNNTAVGVSAGEGVSGTSDYDNNSLFGYKSGFGLTTGSNNLLLGYQAGDTISSGSNNIVIGYDIDTPTNATLNALNIGNLLFGTGINGTGTTISTGNIGIGVVAPTKKLEVDGDIEVTATNDICIAGGNCLSTAGGGTDDQNLSFTGNTLNIEDGTGVDLSPYLDNTDTQDLSLAGTVISLVAGGSVDLAGVTGVGTDDQALSLSGNTLTLEDGGTVNLTPYLDNTDSQALSLVTNTLSLTGGGSVSLASYLDNTDTQDLDLTGNTLSLTDGGTVDLSGYLDNTDTQALSLSANTLSLTGGGSVSLASYLDNTDSQTLGLSGNILNIAGGNNVDLSSFAGGSDNLGNHTATLPLDMATQDIGDAGQLEFTDTSADTKTWIISEAGTGNGLLMDYDGVNKVTLETT